MGHLEVHRQVRPPSPSLDRRRPVPFLGQEPLERGDQKRANSSPVRVGRIQIILLQQTFEERLRQILRPVDIAIAAKGIGVKRRPIRPTEEE